VALLGFFAADAVPARRSPTTRTRVGWRCNPHRRNRVHGRQARTRRQPAQHLDPSISASGRTVGNATLSEITTSNRTTLREVSYKTAAHPQTAQQRYQQQPNEKSSVPPQSGSKEGITASRNRFGQYVRTRAIPSTRPASPRAPSEPAWPATRQPGDCSPQTSAPAGMISPHDDTKRTASASPTPSKEIKPTPASTTTSSPPAAP